MNKFDLFVIGTIIIGTIIMSVGFINAKNSCDIITDAEGYILALDGGVDGMYRTDDYIIINTKGKSPEEIMGIVYHETVHKQVEDNKEHYCEVK